MEIHAVFYSHYKSLQAILGSKMIDPKVATENDFRDCLDRTTGFQSWNHRQISVSSCLRSSTTRGGGRRESVMSPPKWSDESVFHFSRCRKIMFEPRSFMGSRFLAPKLLDWQQVKMTPKIKSKTVSWYFHWTMWNHDNMLTTILIHMKPYYSMCVHFRFNHFNFGKNISNHINLKSSMHIYIYINNIIYMYYM